jgi:hypothetical protein
MAQIIATLTGLLIGFSQSNAAGRLPTATFDIGVCADRMQRFLKPTTPTFPLLDGGNNDTLSALFGVV